MRINKGLLFAKGGITKRKRTGCHSVLEAGDGAVAGDRHLRIMDADLKARGKHE